MIYEFECDMCQKIYEEQFKISECPKSIQCKFCSYGVARKIMSVPAKPKPIFYNAGIKRKGEK